MMKAPEHVTGSTEGSKVDGKTVLRPHQRRRTTALTAIALVLSAVVGIGAIGAWEQIRSSDADRQLEEALAERDEARDRVDVLTIRVEQLRAEISTSSARIATLERALDRGRARLAAVIGPALEDGRHFGYVRVVGATQQPPRLVFDLAEWFTDQEAVEAALEDGVPRPDAGINGYYIRNENPRWRILQVDPDATAMLTTYPIADPANPREVTLDRFGQLFGSADGYLPLSPYWLTVRDGVVVAIEERFIP